MLPGVRSLIPVQFEVVFAEFEIKPRRLQLPEADEAGWMITWRSSFITGCRGPYCSKEAVAMLVCVFSKFSYGIFYSGTNSQTPMSFNGRVRLAKCSEVDRESFTNFLRD